MLPTFQLLWFRLKNRLLPEHGQDLVEYALIVAMLSLCAVAAEKDVATSISGAFQNLATTFNSEV